MPACATTIKWLGFPAFVAPFAGVAGLPLVETCIHAFSCSPTFCRVLIQVTSYIPALALGLIYHRHTYSGNYTCCPNRIKEPPGGCLGSTLFWLLFLFSESSINKLRKKQVLARTCSLYLLCSSYLHCDKTTAIIEFVSLTTLTRNSVDRKSMGCKFAPANGPPPPKYNLPCHPSLLTFRQLNIGETGFAIRFLTGTGPYKGK